MGKKFDESEDQKRRKLRHAPNRPGEGMRVINSYVEDEDYYLELDDDIDVEDDTPPPKRY